jgi:uncharacterized membrane protein YqjE
MTLRLLTDRIGRYRIAAVLVSVGLMLGLFTDTPLWAVRSLYGTGLVILIGTLIAEAWKIHESRKAILDLARAKAERSRERYRDEHGE